MDFIKCLPESQDYMDILIVVDRLTKQVVFIPILTLSCEDSEFTLGRYSEKTQ